MLSPILFFIFSVFCLTSVNGCTSYQATIEDYILTSIMYLPVLSNCKQCYFTAFGQNLEFGIYYEGGRGQTDNFTSFISSTDGIIKNEIGFTTCYPGYCGIKIWKYEYIATTIEMIPLNNDTNITGCVVSSDSCDTYIDANISYTMSYTLNFQKGKCL